jgi:ABC-type nitrate/sulfonate/bicarbonate transport system substrate-binding protein
VPAATAGNPATTTPSGGVPATTNTAANLTIGSVANFNGVPFAVADTGGHFADNGLDVEVQIFADGGQLRSALLGGSLDAILSGTTSMIPVFQADNGVRVTSALTGVGDELIMKESLRAELGTGLANVAKLKGKTIAVNAAGSLSDNDLRTFLAANNLTADTDVKIVAVGSGTAQLQALETGQVDGFIGAEPGGAQAENNGTGYIMLNFAVDPVYPNSGDQRGLVVVFAKKWMDGDGAVPRQFTKAIGQAIQAIRADPNLAVTAVGEMLPDLDPAVLQKAATTFVSNYKVDVPKEGWDSLMTQAKDAGIIDDVVAYEAVVAQYQDIWAETDQ